MGIRPKLDGKNRECHDSANSGGLMISRYPIHWMVSLPIILGLVFLQLRGWSRFNEETGLNLSKKLGRSPSLEEIAAHGHELNAHRLRRIRTLRERATSDPRAARQLRKLLKTEIRVREQILEEVQSVDQPTSGFLDAAKSSTRQEILELKGIQREINRLVGE